MVSVDPSYARKLLRDLAVWSRSIGFDPHRDFTTVERIFGDVNAEASDAVFRFGCDGKPLYIPGPFDSARMFRTSSARPGTSNRVGHPAEGAPAHSGSTRFTRSVYLPLSPTDHNTR